MGSTVNLEQLLHDRLAPAFAVVAGTPVDPVIRSSPHADFQSGAALALARTLGRPAREIAAEVAAEADLQGIAEITVSGPGFLNLTLTDDVIATLLVESKHVKPVESPKRIVLDYSGPNVAKEMHVGHLRSTIIGDSLYRIFAFQGHDVHRVNHLGDWGTPFGMLIEHLIGKGAEGELSVGDLTAFYREARAEFDASEDFRTRARLRVVALQSGDPATRKLWQRLVKHSEEAFQEIYDRLGVFLGPDDFKGESSYQDALAGVVTDLDTKGLLVESDGALCAFPAGFTGRDGAPVPLIVRKGDGGFGYAATDLAALRHRVDVEKADELLYVVGAPQRTHFQMVFAVAREAGWLPDEVSAEHIGFGSVLGADGKMLKTRAGAAVRLADLLDEAENRATKPAIGVAAIRYADLSVDRRGDYVFDLDRMLASTGNTGPYLQYAYARVCSIQRKAESAAGVPKIGHPAERALALILLGLEPAVHSAARTREPHRVAGYLHELAATFSAFYEQCPVLRAEPDIRASRLALVDLTEVALRNGMFLLGIPALEQI
jgi:arginyl-tRNA synthetase